MQKSLPKDDETHDSMSKPILRIAVLAALALVGAGGGFVALGQLQPVVEDRVAEPAPPLRPSYLVAVREPTAEELEQRRALARAKQTQRTIDLTPRQEMDVASAAIATPEGPTARVVSDVNVRSGPGTDSAALSVAAAGTEFAILGQQGGWTQVSLPDGSQGWIASRFLDQ